MLEDLIAGKKSLFADGVHTELRAQENRYRNVTLVQGNLMGNSRSETSGICARVCKNGVFGFSSMAEYSASAAEAVLKAATNNALFLNQRAPKNKPAIPKLPAGTVPVNRVIVDNAQKKYIDFCKDTFLKTRDLKDNGTFIKLNKLVRDMEDARLDIQKQIDMEFD